MPQGGGYIISGNDLIYSIQRTYIINLAPKSNTFALTCNQRIDIPTIEPLTKKKVVVYPDEFMKIIPCIELAGIFLSEFKLTFETNEGVTVLPIEIYPGTSNPLDNPYMSFRYVLVLPRDATGVKSCKIIHRATGKEVQHNFTFGIMPPPYNYDNALFGEISFAVKNNINNIKSLDARMIKLKLTKKSPIFGTMCLNKGVGKQTINIEHDQLFFEALFSYSLSQEPTTHKPKITLHGSGRDLVYTLSLSKSINNVSIDLFTGMITVYARDTGEITQQFKFAIPDNGFETLSFENFDDIEGDCLIINVRGARIE